MEKAKDLHELLDRWPAAAPSADFEQQVWRRIRAGEGTQRRALRLALSGDWMRLAAMVAAVLTGILVAVTLKQPPRHGSEAGLRLDRPGTVTGDYLRQVRGE